MQSGGIICIIVWGFIYMQEVTDTDYETVGRKISRNVNIHLRDNDCGSLIQREKMRVIHHDHHIMI